MKTGGMIYTIVFTFLAAFVFVALLAMANALTGPRIAANAELTLQKAVLRAGGIGFSSDNEALQLFLRDVQQQETAPDLYIIRQAGKSPVYALRFTGQGLWGTITGILAVDKQLTTISGVEIIAHNETPGLGGKIDEESFKAQFRGERIGADGFITMKAAGPGDNNHSNSRVDGISGASRTSQLFGVIINRGLDQLKAITGGLQ